MPAPAFSAPATLTTILLDAGNTLVFLDHEAVSHVLKQAGFEVTPAEVQRVEPLAKRRYEGLLRQGRSHEDGWHLHMAALCQGCGVPPSMVDATVRDLRAVHDDFNLWRVLPDGLLEALTALREGGYRLGVVSNSEGRLDALFTKTGLSEHLEVVVDSALEGVRKPDPRLFDIALQRMAVGASQAMYAGDIPEVDVLGAQRAGLPAVLIDPYDYFPEFVQAPRFPSVAALAAALLR